MNIGSLGGDLLGLIPLGDIVLYINPFHLFMFVTMLIFTFLIAIGRCSHGCIYCDSRSNDYW